MRLSICRRVPEATMFCFCLVFLCVCYAVKTCHLCVHFTQNGQCNCSEPLPRIGSLPRMQLFCKTSSVARYAVLYNVSAIQVEFIIIRWYVGCHLASELKMVCTIKHGNQAPQKEVCRLVLLRHITHSCIWVVSSNQSAWSMHVTEAQHRNMIETCQTLSCFQRAPPSPCHMLSVLA